MHASRCTIVTLSLFAVSCGFGPLDLLGVEAAVTETSENETQPTDDRIEDKDPLFDPDRVVVETFSGCEVTLNKSATVTKLDIVPLSGDQMDLVERVFGSRADAIAHLGGDAYLDASLVPSMEVVNGTLKPVNDGLYAAVEYGVEEGVSVDSVPVYPSKRQFLEDLLAVLVASAAAAPPARAGHYSSAAVDVGAALLLAGEDPVMPGDLRLEAESLVAAFEAEPLYSRPIGFYGWDPVLGDVFRQDRYLQNYQVEYPEPRDPYSTTEAGKAAAMSLAIQSDPELFDRYEGYLALYAVLTNPYANHPVTALSPYVASEASLDDPAAVVDAFLVDNPAPDLLPECQPHFALFPSSSSKETTYFESQYCLSGAPPDLDYMEALIAAIRDGSVDLAPDASSGFYDYQSWALETLLLPERGSESDHLLLTAAYKQKLLDTFRSILTQNRETHVKQLEIGASDRGSVSIEIDLYPRLPAEPFPTFYLRSARAYRFLSTWLETVLGSGFLDSTRRMIEDGTRGDLSLRDEIARLARLLYGLHYLTADAVGLAPELMAEETTEYPEADCRDAATAWLGTWRTDADVLKDPRVMVPVQRDMITQETIYWAVLGIRVVRSRAEFVEGFEPEVVGADTCTIRGFVPMDYWLLVEAFAEVRLPMDTPPPTREELRAVCDAHDSVNDIVAALQAL